MTVQEQSSPRFEINPLPARAHPAGRAGRSPPPRPLFPAPDIARQSEPPDPNRPRITVQAPPSGPASTTVLGEKFSNFFFFLLICKHPPPLTQRWGMKFGPPGAIGLGLARSATPAQPQMHSPTLRTLAGTIPPATPGRHDCADHPLPRGSEEKLVCGGRGLAHWCQTRWARGVGGDLRTQVCEEEGGLGLNTRQACWASAAPSPGLPPAPPFPSFSCFRASGSFNVNYYIVVD